MSKLFACLISKNADQAALIAVATEFAYRIELLEDGILFDISGLEKLIGTPPTIASSIIESMESHNVTGCLAVNPNLETAILFARQGKGFSVNSQRLVEINQTSLSIGKLPLTSLPLEKDTLGVFKSLGLNQINDLQKIPAADLISRYGKGFLPLIDLINENSRRTLNHNLKADSLVWESDLEDDISDFGQLMFLIEHVLQEYLIVVQQNGFSTELIEIYLLLENESAKLYEVKTTRPTLDKTFWLKLVYLRFSSDPPSEVIKFVKIIIKFTKPRPTQKGLYAVTRPEPENLLLTVNKLKKLLGEKNVGVPVLLNQRLPEAFELNAEKLPEGIEKNVVELEKPLVGFYYYIPPLAAQVLIRRKQLIFLKTTRFAGRVAEYSGVWKKNSRWWEREWKTYEWDVELENLGVYRLCRRSQEWFVIGEYD